METTCRLHRRASATIFLLMLVLPTHPVRAAETEAQAVNFGGPRVGDFKADDPEREDDAMRWVTDEPIDTTGVVNPASQEVYQDGLTGRITHTFKSLIAGKTYTVRIHYAEVYGEAPRERMSNVYINDKAVRSGYDVFGATGTPYTATVQEYLITADERGRATIAFLPVDRSGSGVCVAGIQILPYTPPGPQPVGWWRFDEVGTTTVKDAIGLHNGTVEGPWRGTGRLGGGLRFDGWNDYVAIDGAAALLAGEFTVSCWILGGTPGRVIASVQDGPNLLMVGQTAGILTSELVVPPLAASSLPSIMDPNWHHIAVTSDHRRLTLYRDGIEGDNVRLPFPVVLTGRLHIGADGFLKAGRFWDGLIDDVRIYDHALTAAEIGQLWDDARRTQTTGYNTSARLKPGSQGLVIPSIAPLSLNLDASGALGAVLGADATEKEIRDFARDAGFTGIQILEPENLVLLDLPTPLDRSGLARRASQIRSMLEEPSAQRIFRDIGMVVRPGEATVPMLVLDSFIVQFWSHVSQTQIDQLNAENAVEIVRRSPYVSNLFLLRVTDQSQDDAIDMANTYHSSELTEYAVPNFAAPVDLRQDIPNDEFFGQQWHLHNDGQDGGTADADIDAPQAWEITTGRAANGRKVVIAIIDGGFDASHPDLKENLWVNARELEGSAGVDDDNNGYIDDIRGWDFGMNTGTLPIQVHGTAAAGCAGAQRNNGIGVAGSCPDGSLMLLSYGEDNYSKAEAIDYACDNGADVISLSWGYFSDIPKFLEIEAALRRATRTGRNGRGCIVFIAMTNGSRDNGSSPYDLAALEDVIGVSRTTNQDGFNPGGFGKCMDVLGPTHGGSRSIATTDNQREAGYNVNGTTTLSNCPTWPGEAGNTDYTLCFNGTSAACPIVAGVAGLVLSVAPDLDRLQVQRLLQDTADKVEPSKAGYSEINGFSNWPFGLATHGYGRVNAFEAVRVVGPRDKGGRGGTDIFVRDNALDWGNTEQPSCTRMEATRGFIPYWESPDIRIDVDPYQTQEPDRIVFDNVVDEVPLAGKKNRIFVRVRNRGPQPDPNVAVKLFWCTAEPNQEPDLPEDLWARFPGNPTDTTRWKPLRAKTIATLPYSGSSVAGTGSDLAQFVYFDLDLGQYPPGPCCLLAIVSSDQDPVSATTRSRTKIREITPYDNNVAQRNVVIASSQ